MIYWSILIGFIAIGFCAVFYIYKFTASPSKEQIDKIINWLIYATLEAEKDLGSGTGKLKLATVYDMFIARFPQFAKMMKFEQFSKLVDEALIEMRKILNSNRAIAEYVNSNETDSATLAMNEAKPKTQFLRTEDDGK